MNTTEYHHHQNIGFSIITASPSLLPFCPEEISSHTHQLRLASFQAPPGILATECPPGLTPPPLEDSAIEPSAATLATYAISHYATRTMPPLITLYYIIATHYYCTH